jgi:hypothetical protein
MPGGGVQEEFEAEGRNNLPIDTRVNMDIS